MRKLVFLSVFAAICLSTSGFVASFVQAKSEKLIRRPSAIAGRYIVVLNESKLDNDIAAPVVEGNAQYLTAVYGGNVGNIYSAALKGFVAEMNREQAETMSRDANVAFIEEDSEISISSSQLNPGWNLDRVDQRNLPWDGAYNYNETGAGVHAYIIDTGIRASHVEFGGRASAVFDNVGDGQNGADCNGHGTHVAGIIGSSTYGVAKGVFLHGVRVIPCNGSGAISNLINGIDWVTAHRINPAVANISITAAGSSPSLETSVTNSINSGVTFAIAAGNGGGDACNFTPARTPAALTAGASDQTDLRALFSNGGPCVDIFAPGHQVVSTWSSSDTATNSLSGSSMAAPMVAGAAAVYLQSHPNATSSAVASAILGSATTGVMDTLDTTSPNMLLYSFVNGAPAPTPTPTATPTATPTPTPTPPTTVKVTVKKRGHGTSTTSNPATFQYQAVNLSSANFALLTDQDYVDPNVQPSTPGNPVVITEAAVPGWQLLSISCIDAAGGVPNTSVDLANHNVSIVGAAGQQIECTFMSEALIPTAANATISGRVTYQSGIGIRGMSIELVDASSGEQRFSRTNTFGLYQFGDIPVGRTYIVVVHETKRWRVPDSIRTVVVNDDLANLNFMVEDDL